MHCSIDGCSKPKRSKNQPLCDMHYCRVRRTGKIGSATPRPVLAGLTCVIDDCHEPQASVTGWCDKHHTRYRRHGNPLTRLPHSSTPQETHPQWKAGGVGYSGAHMRIRVARGAASGYPCTDCHRPAQQWSYSHADPNEKQSELGPYSATPDYYEPRCVSCHKTFDLARGASVDL